MNVNVAQIRDTKVLALNENEKDALVDKLEENTMKVTYCVYTPVEITR